MKMTKQHYEFLTDEIMPLLPSCTSIEDVADKLESTNDLFNRAVFVARSLKKWEDKNIPRGMIECLDELIEEVTS